MPIYHAKGTVLPDNWTGTEDLADDAPARLREEGHPYGTDREPESPTQPLRILLVDDNAASLRLLQRMLVEEGAEVLTATNALDAVALAHSEMIDAMFIDLRMRPIGGLEVLRRTQGAIPRRFVLTGYADVNEEQEARDLGATEILYKPVDVEEMLRLAGREEEDG